MQRLNMRDNQREEQLQFNRYQIPPDFQIVQLHHDAAKVYDQKGGYMQECPCCLRKVGSKKQSICTSSGNFLRITPQIPLYFSFIKVITVALALFASALGIQRMFSETIEIVSFKFQPPTQGIFILEIGFMQTRREIRFVFFLIFVLLIIFIRGYLKASKYRVNYISQKISDRSIMLTNVKESVTIEEIKQKFQQFQIQKVQLTYKVKDYIDHLQVIYKLKKAFQIAKRKKKGAEYLNKIFQEMKLKNEQVKIIKNQIKQDSNRLDFSFVTFSNQQSRNLFLRKYKTNLLSRLYFKFSTCCSRTAIHGQHINVYAGPDPQDIDWLNLQSSYWVKKSHRFACYYMSFSILIFGILLQYQISTFPVQSLYVSIIKNVVIFVGNFLVVNLLQFTTYQIQKHQINTNKVISLIKKLTFFVFLNLSMSPLSIYLYYQFSSTQQINPQDTPFDELCLSILLISVSNIMKPLVEYLNVGRILKRWSFYYQRFLDQDCQMSQEEANLQYEPIPFPLAAFYSLLISALFLISFFLPVFQIIIIVQIISCLILYGISKYMLLRVCKQPIGLNHIISVTCQRMIMLCIPIYWVGEKVMYYIYIRQYQESFRDYLANLIQKYTIIELSLIAFIIIFSSKIVSLISRKVVTNNSITDSLIQRRNQNSNKMTYEDVNAVKQLEQELTKYIEASRI